MLFLSVFEVWFQVVQSGNSDVLKYLFKSIFLPVKSNSTPYGHKSTLRFEIRLIPSCHHKVNTATYRAIAGIGLFLPFNPIPFSINLRRM